jgi:ribosomal protein S18 acetylase RimI-like enzyme
MAALPETRMPEVVDLHEIHVDDLESVLEEELLTWRAKLYWDFEPSADLVRRFVRMQALSGYALVIDGDCIGYSYFVSEDRKALIGDLFVLNRFARPEYEDILLGAVLNALAATPGLHRIEAQLMMMHGAFERPLPYGRYLHIHPRNLMLVDGDRAAGLLPGRAAGRYAFAEWLEEDQDEAAQLIASAYRGHVDSTINDQYRTPAGARRFLNNIVQYPGCGVFNRSASITVRQSNRMIGLCLASQVADNVGHITQICVSPEIQGTGVGYELLRRSLLALGDAGCESTSLTVTAANQPAIGLYQGMGFRAVRHFAAYVWDGL